jgi:formate dehydrogenase alpha subunit
MEKQIPIVCSYCGVGCNLELLLDDSGKPVKSTCSGRNRDLNGKYICTKGFAVHELATHPERLKTPLVRKNGKFEKASWDEAIGMATGRLREIINRYGSESIGFLCSGKILNEEAYLCQKFQRAVVGNNHIDNCARLCHGPSEVALRKQLGFGAVSTFMEDYNITETVMVVGANTLATHPVIWMGIRKRAKKGEINLILADPRGTDLAKSASIHLKPKPGTDIYWLNALGKIIYENGWHDEKFCRQNTIGFQAYINTLEQTRIEDACEKAGVCHEALGKVAELIRGKKTIGIWGMGLTQHGHGTDNVSAFINLMLLTGNIGKPGCGVAPLRGQNNVQGATDMGALPNVLPGHMHLGDATARLHIGAIWNAVLPEKPGLAAPEMIHQIADGKIRALYVVGENPVMSEPQSAFVSWMMRRLDLLIIQDIFPTATSKYAHIIFPATAVGEKAGTYTNAARRIQYTMDGLTPPGESKADWEILQDMANAMGHRWDYASTQEIWEEIRLIAPVFSGVTHSRLKQSNGLFWPCYDETHSGTPRLYEDGFAFRDRRARFVPCDPPDHYAEPTEEYPYMLITGRVLGHFNTGEMSRRSTRLTKAMSSSYIESSPEDADKEGLSDGDAVQITSPYGSVTSRLKIGKSAPNGYLFGPIHFNNPNYNALMSAVPLDPQARMPALKVVPVSITRVITR